MAACKERRSRIGRHRGKFRARNEVGFCREGTIEEQERQERQELGSGLCKEGSRESDPGRKGGTGSYTHTHTLLLHMGR